MKRPELNYVAALDGVRAFAVAAVLLYHGGVHAPGGFLGVDVFFVLSGYLITSLLLVEHAASGRIALPRFWGRRARRLLPAALLVIATCAVIAAIGYPADLPRVRGDALASILYVNNWHQILGDHSYFAAFGRPSTLQHLWSLAVEEQFYLFWPILLGGALAAFGRTTTAGLTVAAAVVSALGMGLLFRTGHDPSRVYYGTDTHAAGMLTGAALAFVWPLGARHVAPRRGAVAVLDAVGVAALVLLVVAMANWHDYDPWVYRGGIALAGVAAACMIAVAVHPDAHLGRALGVAPLVWIGRRSYGIYLWHWPVMALTRPGADLAWSRWVLVPAQLAVTIGLAAASYRYVEMPVRNGTALRSLRTRLDRFAPRQRLGIATAAGATVIVAVLAVALRSGTVHTPPALARTTAAAKVSPATAPQPNGARRPLAVGASVMAAAQPELGRRMTVDAAVGRQVDAVINRLDAYRAAGQLPRRVAIQIGENGPLFSSEVGALKAALRGVRRVVLVNIRVPRSWEAEVNATLAQAVHGWHGAVLADWHTASGRPGLLYDDGTHPNPAGQRVYTRLVERALRR
jgi:peptidoglycan/LPS O-acetylase OafA/YrhL